MNNEEVVELSLDGVTRRYHRKGDRCHADLAIERIEIALEWINHLDAIEVLARLKIFAQ